MTPPDIHVRRGFVGPAIIAIAMMAFAPTACSQAQTDAQYQAGVGANVRTGPVQLFNALAVHGKGGAATVSATVLNTTDRTIRLTSASARLSNDKKATVRTTPAIISPREAKQIGPGGNIVVTAPTLDAGQYVRLTLRFTHGYKAVVDAPVVADSAMYDDIATGSDGPDETGGTATATPAPAPR